MSPGLALVWFLFGALAMFNAFGFFHIWVIDQKKNKSGVGHKFLNVSEQG